jgi:AcrR family transcriptional regulator
MAEIVQPRRGGDARERLLDAAVAYVSEHGLGDLSLRALARALGTSHRMLIYHFGSKEELLVEVVRAVEERQRDALAAVDPGESPTQAQLMRTMWRRFADPSLAPNERLFFELYGQALQGRPHTAHLLDGIVESWVEPAVEISSRYGVPDDVARVDARLAVAVTRGLLLDLLATGDRAAVDAAMERFVALYERDGPLTERPRS